MFDPRKLRELREDSGMTLDAVGSKMIREGGARTPLTMVHQLERKHVQKNGSGRMTLTEPVNVQLDTLLRLCDVFNVSVYDLLTDDVLRKHTPRLMRTLGLSEDILRQRSSKKAG